MAEMFVKISAISYLLIISSTSAALSERLVHEDGPYKYTSQHDLAEKIMQKNTETDHVAVQYAPLYSPEIHIRNEMDILPKINVNENAEVRKKIIEPNLASYTHSSLPYVPGHNIEILQSVNRSPGLPVEYRSISDTTETSLSDNEKKMNYHRAFSVFKKPENLFNIANNIRGPNEISVPPTNEPLDQYTRVFKLMTNPVRDDKYNPEPLKVLLDQQLLRNHQTLQDIHELTKQIESQRVVGYPKMNTMLLNLARVYSPRAPASNHMGYLDPVNENGIKNTQPFIRSPSLTYSETKRSRAMPIVIANSDVNPY